MLIKWRNIYSTAKLLKEVRKWKMTIIVKSKLMYLTLRDNYKKSKVKWLWKPLRWITWNIWVYRIDTFNKKEIKRINYYLKKHQTEIFYNTLNGWKNIIETN